MAYRRDVMSGSALLLAAASVGARPAAATGVDEARAMMAAAARESGQCRYSREAALQFRPQDNVFVRSALAIELTPGRASVTLPLFRGLSPSGDPVFYIITEASDFATAAELGVSYAPKMRHAMGSRGAQAVTIENGTVRFRGNVDFAPQYEVAPGAPYPFPPRVAKPGAVGDAEWSSMCVTPGGVVLNAQMVHNASGDHDRVLAKDLERRTVTLTLIDGFQNGRQYFYHLVTDVSAMLPAVLEKGVYTPRLANVPEIGKSLPTDQSALLGFSPVVNGIIDPATGQHQGFASSLANGGIDPINVFPIGPDNDNEAQSNNYSPLWDAHVSQWTDAAARANRTRRITSLDDLKGLVEAGHVTSATINPPGEGNTFVAGLRPTKAIINCPVICHPTAAT